ncbi:TMEM175 family protein [Mucilaginibacter sp. X4EP1]|uniref:TMEM175 family protein n=1 Tax=Mucilaginibacter sp. X4EP1 TaxID=2723092 RepID=UPI00216A1C54|nr:TMEM175 family protein [Mucilaginibacter sp. X4EP1]MCS3813505.1 putative membrane protein [Mucilaginibacter sp. X4EP1]
MNVHDENEIKKEFQLERLIFFSDAVFAIIITIMILDVKLPEMEKLPSELVARDAFLRIIPKLIGYGVSFYAVGELWMKHLRIFSFLKEYNPQLLVINLVFLFSVSLFPFGLSFFFNSGLFIHYTWGVFTYIGIYYFTQFTQTMLISYLINNKEELCYKTDTIETALQWKLRRLDYFAAPIVTILMLSALYFDLTPRISYYIVFTPIIIYRVVANQLQKRYYPHYKQERITLLSLFGKNKGIPMPTLKNKKKATHLHQKTSK